MEALIVAMTMAAAAAGGQAAGDAYTRPMALEVAGMADVRVERDVPYRDGANAPRLDVYRPRPGGRHPVVLFVPGGPVPPGVNPREWGVFTSYGRAAAAQGFVAVVAEHGFHAVDGLPAAAANVAAAVEWVRASADRFDADPSRLALWGFSGAGMLLAPLIASPPGGLRALVLFYAGLDITPSTLAARPDMRAWSAVSALEARPDWTIPLVIGRGGRDDARLNEAMDRFVAAALKKQAPLDLLVHPSGPHGFDVLTHDARSRDIIARTFQIVAAATGLGR